MATQPHGATALHRDFRYWYWEPYHTASLGLTHSSSRQRGSLLQTHQEPSHERSGWETGDLTRGP